VTRTEILKFWIATHGPLTPELQDEFLARDELAYMLVHSSRDVQDCIRKHKKLRDIVTCLRGKAESDRSGEPRTPRGPKSSPTSRGSRPKTRSGRSRTAGEVWDRPARYGSTDRRYK